MAVAKAPPGRQARRMTSVAPEPDLARLRPPPGTAALNLGLGALFLASVPLSFAAVDRAPLAAVAATPWMIFAFTGLFILAHEAIHGLLWPGHPRASHALGAVFAFAYAFMDYRTLRGRHGEHHAAPGGPSDPDAHPSGRFAPHLAAFVLRYLNLPQVALLVLAGNRLGAAGHTRAMLLAWVVPLVGSTLVIFSLGIHFVHHPALVRRGLADPRHHAVAVDLGPVLSFATVLFFNYHWLHHEHPHLTWAQLGRHRRRGPPALSFAAAFRNSRPDRAQLSGPGR